MPDNEPKVTDRRASRARHSGIIVGQSVAEAKALTRNNLAREAVELLSKGRSQGAGDQPWSDMRQMRRARTASISGGVGGSSLTLATGRPRDLMFYWQQRNLPYDISDEAELKKLRALCRVIYATHPVIASAIDIFCKYPLVGMEFVCKDKALTEFYTELMFNQLNYEDYLIDVGREYWTVGEAWPLGSFNEDLGVWEADELIDPDDVFVERSPFLRDPRFEIKLPESLRKVIQTRQPKHEYDALMRSYPELAKFANDANAKMPVSNILLKQLKFKGDTFHKRGIPILLRGLRAVMQEEMLNAAQDAIADRLYTPLILARLGASAEDLGTTSPWIPNDEDLAAFEDALDTALAADFRVLTHHFAVQMDTVFGRETMPNFDADFERLTERQLQVFGMSKTMLMGAGQGETYAADALNRDLISQLLTTYQRLLKRVMRDRMLVVAEAQEHYDYEVRGSKRYPVMEEVLEVDEETGEQRIVEQPKLLVPEVRMRTMNIRDEQTEQAFIEALRASGVPISMETRLTNIPINFKDEMEKVRQEQVDLAVEAQETRKATYLALKARRLPIPPDLAASFDPKALGAAPPTPQTGDTAAPEARPQLLGVDPVNDSALVPGPEDMMSPPGVPSPEQQLQQVETGPGGTVVQLPQNRMRPPESDEQRAGMPVAGARRFATREVQIEEDDEVRTVRTASASLTEGPSHVGMRRNASVNKNTPLGDAQPDDPGYQQFPAPEPEAESG